MNLPLLQLLAGAEIKRHGLHGWRFELTNKIRALGRCKYGPRVIQIQRTYAAREERPEVWDTLLHEIAHALTTGNSHGPLWQAKCREIGAKPEATCKYAVHQKPTRYYVATCNVCVAAGKTHVREHVGGTHWYKRRPQGLSKDGTGFRCGRCNTPLLFSVKVIRGKR